MDRFGFTAVEVIVAAGIFVAFMGGLFQLFRMGNQMYSAGTWRYTRQKQAEAFFHTLRERIEQASNIVCIDQRQEGGGQLIQTTSPAFIALSESQPINPPSSGNKIIAEFTIGKPCIIDKSGKVIQEGLILYNSLLLSRQKNGSGKKPIGNLCFRVAREIAGDSNFKNALNWPPSITSFPSESKFSDNPNNYSLGAVPRSFVLEDVSSIVLQFEKATGNTDFWGTMKMNITFCDPKTEKSDFAMIFSAKIDKSVNEVTIGSI